MHEHDKGIAMNAPVPLDDFATQAASAFRGAMRQLAGGVSVITVGVGAERSGMTVTSVTSLSVEPPTLIVCVNRQSSSWPLLLRHQVFGVNILRAEQRDVAIRFSGQGNLAGAARFGDEPVVTAETGAPLLANALAAIDCEAEALIDHHSHVIVIGRVKAVRLAQGQSALVYWRGQYLETDGAAPSSVRAWRDRGSDRLHNPSNSAVDR
jgi:flavin reductase (DIM6/NTAB) family NADH-FMN oxidoreductase RutF